MKNLLLLVALLVGVYFYLYPSVEPAAPAVAPPPASAPTPRLHLYYHSPLDAPAMASGSYTGSGYHSIDSASDFGPGVQLGTSTARQN